MYLRELIRSDANNADYRFLQFCMANAPNSTAQLFQDLLPLFLLRPKQPGFFVEFGATDGVFLSNTLLLESKFQWNGILAEPAQKFHAGLRANRKAALDFRCVWSETGRQMPFHEAEDGELSTLDGFGETDHHSALRAKGRKYAVESVSLNDLLKSHNAPRKIDYLSMDTEGSELEILKAFDFSAYDVSILTIEHNFLPDYRAAIHSWMSAAGYDRIFENLSAWDDWYVKRGTKPE